MENKAIPFDHTTDQATIQKLRAEITRLTTELEEAETKTSQLVALWDQERRNWYAKVARLEKVAEAAKKAGCKFGFDDCCEALRNLEEDK
jgi:vacuolar-type H+-ATPase subunit I/STV1